MTKYAFEDRGSVKRYYNIEKRARIESIRGESYKEYRRQWDDRNQINHVRLNPLEIMLELTSWCNYCCEMCYKNYKLQKEKINMPVEMIKNIVEQAKTMDIKSFWLGAGSECLIHPNIIEILRLLGEVQVEDFTLITNGSCLTKSVAKVLIDSGVTQLSVSLDAVTSSTYQKIRKADLSKVEENIRNFLEIRGNNLFPALRVTMVEVDDNLEERAAFLEKWSGIADVIDYQVLMDYSKMDDFEHIGVFEAECLEPFRRMLISYDGEISACDTQHGDRHIVGNVNNMTLRDAWLCEKAMKLRENIRMKNFCDICKRCKAIV